MSKEKSAKKEKKEKKRSDSDGVKKSKKEKKKDVPEHVAEAAVAELETNGGTEPSEKIEILRGPMVPFANPLADDKVTKKILKAVRKNAKNKSIKRGVKECVKAIRKVPSDIPPHSMSDPRAVVVIAADISPPDVISHLPVLCENNNLPYIFVPSRVELGTYGNTKRPTSVVMIVRDLPKKNNNLTDEEKQEHAETFKDLLKTVRKAGA